MTRRVGRAPALLAAAAALPLAVGVALVVIATLMWWGEE